MMEPTLNQLKDECALVRQAAQQISDEGQIKYMPPFPRGWCGKTSRVLGVWLLQNFPHCEFFYVCRYQKNNARPYQISHAWVEYQDIVLDVTADQFETCNDKIIVKRQKDSTFHSGFEPVIPGDRYATAPQIIDYPEERLIYKRVRELSKTLH